MSDYQGPRLANTMGQLRVAPSWSSSFVILRFFFFGDLFPGAVDQTQTK